jgi:hypothetical protein
MRAWVLAPALLVIAPAAGRGQMVEITPVAGYRFGGGFTTAAGIEPAATAVDFEVEDAASFGVHLGVRVAEDGELEILYSRQDTRLGTDELFAGDAFCETGGECLVHAKGSDISQAEVRAGLVLRF